MIWTGLKVLLAIKYGMKKRTNEFNLAVTIPFFVDHQNRCYTTRYVRCQNIMQKLKVIANSVVVHVFL